MESQSYTLRKPLAEVGSEGRAAFIRRTYEHVAYALLAFVALESVLLNIPGIENLVVTMVSGYAWLVVLGLFWVASSVSQKMAMNTTSKSKQYAGLGLMVVAYAFIFVPILYVAAFQIGGAVILQAAIVTAALFIGLTLVVFITGKDFSFLRTAITIGSFIALGAIVAGVIFGFNLGLWFSVGMIVLVSGAILYQTSNLVHEYNTDQHVAASLGLFASFMTLFFYILRIFMSRD